MFLKISDERFSLISSQQFVILPYQCVELSPFLPAIIFGQLRVIREYREMLLIYVVWLVSFCTANYVWFVWTKLIAGK